MKPKKLPSPIDANAEISALIEALHKTEQRLDELTVGEVDSVTDRHGRTFLLRRAQEQSRDSEVAKQTAILNALPAHIALLDPQGQIISVNEAWRQFGRANAAHAPGHDIGVNYLAICDNARGADASEARQAGAGIRSILSGEAKNFSLEYPCHSPTQQRWFLMTVTPLSDERLNGAVVMHLNVTAEKLSKENLTVSESRFRQMADNITDVFWITSPDLNVIHYVSPAYQLIWGRPRENLYANPHQWIETIIPEDRDRVFAAFATLMAKEAKITVEYRVARPDGTIRWVRDRGFQVRDATDNLVRLTGIVTDITESKAIEETLQRKQSELHALFDLIPAMIWFKNTENDILRVNKRVAQAAGMSVEEIEGKPSLEIYPQDAAKYFADDLEVIHSGAPKLAILETLRGPDGKELWVQTDKVPYRNKDGKVIGIVVMAQDVTERKRVEDEAKQLQNVLEASLNEIYIFDAHTLRFNYVNDSARRNLGYTMEAMRQQTPLDIKPEFTPAAFQELIEPLRRHQQPKIVFKTAHRRVDGSLYPVEVHLQLVEHSGKAVFLAVINDITERKRSEQVADRALLRLTEAQRIGQIGDWEWDIATQTITWSPQVFEIVGRDPRLGPPRDYEEHAAIYDAASQALMKEKVNLAIETGEAQSYELLARRSNGEQVYVLARAMSRRDESGAVVGLYGTIQDITTRKLAEQALQTSEAEFRTMAEAMPQIVWITRADGWNIYFNQQWVDYTGLTLEESLGHGWNKPFHPDDQQQAWSAWQKATETVGVYSIESRLRRADGVYRWWLVRGVPQQDASGKILKWFGTCTDIHDLKMAELEITQNNQALRKSEVRIKYLNRVYAMLSGINTVIVRIRSRDELFREACRIAVEDGGFRMSLICIVNQVTRKIVSVASAGQDEGLMSAIKDNLLSSDEASNTMIGRAIREAKTMVSNDSQSDPRILFRKQHTKSGIHSMAVFPLIVMDKLIGVVALYATENEFFHEEELKLLTDLTNDIAFGIDHIDKQERLDYLAYYDVLTGLANRALFHERLEQSAISAGRLGHKLALLLLDIERFKTINDSLGRAVGDALLKAVALRMTKYAGDATRLARIDADHFAVMVLNVQSAEQLARLIEQRIAEIFSPPYLIGESELRLAVKFGIAMFPADGVNADTLFRNAEAALKYAKRSGERYLFYSHAMNEHTADKLLLENQLRQAIEKSEFVLHYQPKINLVSGMVTSAEALIRWNDPRTGLVPPGRFIPILEETGLIYEVGRWALRQAIADYLRWRNAGLPAVRIAVNVSPLQLRDRGFIAEIEQAIGIDAQAAAGLELEITESLIMEDVKHTIASLQTIRDMGITIAIDDFGTGFSSLSYLAKLPVDTLKIDRSFVIDMTAGPEGLALVSTIVNLAHSLKLKVVAEGVETEEQSRLLRLLSCDEMQGFLFSKPLPRDDFEAKFLAPARAGEKI